MSSHLANLGRATYDLGLYPEVQRQRLRRTFAHLVLLVLLSTVAATAVVALGVRDLVRKVLPEVDKLPTITIKDGQASANVPQPWTKRLGRDDESGRELVLIIDTIDVLPGFGEDQMGLFLQRTNLLVKPSDGQVRVIPLERIGDRVIGPQLIRTWLVRMQWLAPLVFGVAAFVYFWLMKGLQALVLVLVGLLAATGRRRPLGFGSLFAIGVYALTPAVLIDCLLRVTRVQVPFWWLLYLGIAIVYTVLAVRRTPDEPRLIVV
jgi:hypothetical protein